MNPVVHFEMPYENAERINAFYAATFGWKMNVFGEEMGHYITAATTETDENNMVTKPGTINGGFFPKNAAPGVGTSVVVFVPDIQEGMQRVNANGGQVLGEPMLIPGVGHYVSFNDTEGNRLSLLQPLMA